MSGLLQLALATPVVVWGGKPFFERGLASIKARSLNMFTLIAIGTAAAFGFSVVALLLPDALPHAHRHGTPPLYFEAAAVIITLVLLGQVLELRARRATSGALRALLGLQPKTARRLVADGREEDIALEHVRIGDRLRVRPSEKVPVDGVVLEGGSPVDESMISAASTHWPRRSSKARARGLTPRAASDFRSHVGRGITGTVDGHDVALGNARLLAERSLELGDLADSADALRAEGQTVMFVAVDARVVGLVAVADAIKPSTSEALAQLRDAGVNVVMLTGDNRTTARAVARTLGIDEVHAEVLPDQKQRVVAALRDAGKIVAMAGDGTNDAPALAQAHVGIAMGTGTDVAIQSAHVTLVKGDLRGIVRARRLSAHVMRNIRQNLFFAFVYNALGVPLAAGVLYPAFGLLLSPMFASAAMALSSVSVIANALRLRTVEL